MNRSNLPHDDVSLSDALAALADPTRLKILFTLAEGESHVGALQERLGSAQATVSHHLGILRRAGMVRTRRDGKRVYYSQSESQSGPGAVRVAAGSHTITVRSHRRS